MKGSSTSEEKLKTISEANIEAYVIALNEEGITGNYTDFLTGTETVVINIPLNLNPAGCGELLPYRWLCVIELFPPQKQLP